MKIFLFIVAGLLFGFAVGWLIRGFEVNKLKEEVFILTTRCAGFEKIIENIRKKEKENGKH